MLKKIVIASSAIVLTAAGAFAGRLTAKKANATEFWAKQGSGACTQVASSVTTAGNFTTGGSGTQVSIKTAGGVNTYNIYNTSGCNPASAVRFHF